MTAGPAWVAAATPVSTKMPAPIICPMPMKMRSVALSERRNRIASSASGSFLRKKFMEPSESIRVERARKPLGRNQRKAQGDGAPAPGMEDHAPGGAQDRAAELVGHDQPRRSGQQALRKLRRYCEVEQVAERQIVRPFVIGLEVGNRNLDLDTDDGAVAADGRD